MTEKEWLASEDTQKLYWEVRPRGARYRRSSHSIMTRRLGALFGVACIRATLQSGERPFVREVAGIVERVADEGAWDEVKRWYDEARRQCSRAANTVGHDTVPHFWALVALRLVDDNVDSIAMHVPLFLAGALKGEDDLPALRKTYADLLRDIAGNPFRGGRGQQLNPRKRKPPQGPVFRPEWRTDTVLSLARTMYESRDFSAVPILADALQDAGCEQSDILSHCRDTFRPHARGCWVVDLVLGRQ